MGPDRDVARIDTMLDDLARRVDEIGLDPGWGPFVDDALALNAAAGLELSPPIT